MCAPYYTQSELQYIIVCLFSLYCVFCVILCIMSTVQRKTYIFAIYRPDVRKVDQLRIYTYNIADQLKYSHLKFNAIGSDTSNILFSNRWAIQMIVKGFHLISLV